MSVERVRISDVCEVTGGTTPSTRVPEYWDGDVTWLSPVDLPAVGTIVEVNDSQRKITAKALTETSLRMLPVGAVVYSTRASIGKIGHVVKPLVTNQGFTNMIPGPRINNRYLAYALKYFTPQIEALGNSTTFNEVSRTAIKNFELPLPSLEIQQRIADTLDTADALCRKDQELLGKYDELAQSTFYKLFGDVTKTTTKWPTQNVGSVCNVTKLAGFEYTKYITYSDSGQIAVVKGMNVKREALLLNNVNYITKEVSDLLPRSKLHKGDIVMTYIGVNIGDVAIIEESDKYHLAPNVAKITTANPDVLNPFFLLKYLSLNRHIFEQYTTNTAKQALNMGNIREIKVPLPSIKLQREYEQVYKKVRQMRALAVVQLSQSQNLFDSHLKSVFA